MLTLLADLTPAAAVSGAIGVTATASIPVLLLAGAEYWAWPNLRPLGQVAVDVGHDLNRAIATSQRVARHTGRRLALAALQVRDRTRLALYDAALAALRHLAPKGTTR